MQFSFNYSTFRGFFDSFSEPVRERVVHVVNGNIKVQQRGEGDDARFYLRIRSGFSNFQYQRIEWAQMLALAEALVDMAQDCETQEKDNTT